MSYLDWLPDWPFLFAALSIPVLLLLLAFLALWPRRSKWKAALCVILGYLVVANFSGLFVYQWVPAQYTRDQNWSWPPTDDRSLGLSHGKRLASAAGQGTSAPRSVYEEQADFFRKWLLGPAMAGLALTILATLAFTLFRGRNSGDGKKRTTAGVTPYCQGE